MSEIPVICSVGLVDKLTKAKVNEVKKLKKNAINRSTVDTRS